MLKAIKVRLYPNKDQQFLINKLLGCYRFTFNACLQYKKERYDLDKTPTSLSDFGHFFHRELRKEYEWLQEQNTKVIKQSILNLQESFHNFFTQGTGFPTFKSKKDIQKARFPIEAVSKKTFNEEKSTLNLTTKIKGLKFECSKEDKKYLYKNKKEIKSVTISKTKSGKYFASILIDASLEKKINKPKRDIVGIDLGIKTLMVLSDGTTFENKKFTKNNERKLKKLQRQHSRKEKGSKNREKARIKLAKEHEKIVNKKTDYLHNITTKIINDNQVIVLEDLNVSGMMKNHNLAKAIQELSMAELRRQLECKAKWYGREIVIVSRWFPSSKTCSCCGWKNKELKLSDREFVCKECGLVIDRDENAAINIEEEGRRLYNKLLEEQILAEENNKENKIGQRLSEFKLVDYPTKEDGISVLMDDPTSNGSLKSSGRLKQEEEILKFT